MELVEKDVSIKDINYSKIKEIYKEAFPLTERAPLFYLHMFAKKQDAQFTAYYDNDMVVGLSYVILYRSSVFILYLAIDKDMRSKGYGTKILENLKERYSDKSISLNIEEVIECSNYEERLKRKEFYERNGFKVTGMYTREFGENFHILTHGNFNEEDFKQICKKIYLNIYTPKIYKRKKE